MLILILICLLGGLTVGAISAAYIKKDQEIPAPKSDLDILYENARYDGYTLASAKNDFINDRISEEYYETLVELILLEAEHPQEQSFAKQVRSIGQGYHQTFPAAFSASNYIWGEPDWDQAILRKSQNYNSYFSPDAAAKRWASGATLAG